LVFWNRIKFGQEHTYLEDLDIPLRADYRQKNFVIHCRQVHGFPPDAVKCLENKTLEFLTTGFLEIPNITFPVLAYNF
jgi:hypothetical protein